MGVKESKSKPSWPRAWVGTSLLFNSGLMDISKLVWEGIGIPRLVKLNRGGRARFPLASPLVSGSLVSGFRSSSKNSWVRASRAVNRAVGVYCNKFLRRSIASLLTWRRKI